MNEQDIKDYISALIDLGYTDNEIVEKVKELQYQQIHQEKDTSYTDKLKEHASAGFDKITSAWTSDIENAAKDLPNVSPTVAKIVRVLEVPLKTLAGAVEIGFSPISAGIQEGLEETGLQEPVAKALAPIASGIRAIDTYTDGQFSNMLEVIPLFKAGTVAKSAGTVAKKTAETATKAVKNISLKEMFQKGLDTAVVGASKTAEAVKKVPEIASEAVKKSIDRQNIRLVTEAPEKAIEKIKELYKQAIVPGVKFKKKSVKKIEDIDQSVVETTQRLAKYDIDQAENPLQAYAEAIDLEKRQLWSKIEEGLKKAGEKGKVSLKPIVEQLDELAKSEKVKIHKSLQRAIERIKNDFVDENGNPLAVSPSAIQDRLASLNQELGALYRGSKRSSVAESLVLAGVAQKMRQMLDKVVDKLDDKSFQEYKNTYKQLKNIEEDVVHRAIYEAQKGAGLGKYADILASGDILGGMIGADPAFLAKGLGIHFTKEIINALNDKAELIRQMFVIGKALKKLKSKQKFPKDKETPSYKEIVPPKGEKVNIDDATLEKKSLEKVAKEADKILEEYKQKNGKIINTDEFRKFFADIGYRGYNAAAVHKAAKKLSDMAYKKWLKENDGDKVAFLAGGSGVGKSTAVKNIKEVKDIVDEAAVVFDGNLSKYESALKKIKEAEKNGKEPVIVYVYRPPRDAFEGVIGRMLDNPDEMGRLVPASITAANHIGSWKTIQKLYQDGYRIRFIDNSLGYGNAKEVSYKTLKSKVKYPEIKQLIEHFRELTKELYEAGKITKEQYNQLIM